MHAPTGLSVGVAAGRSIVLSEAGATAAVGANSESVVVCRPRRPSLSCAVGGVEEGSGGQQRQQSGLLAQ